MAAVAAVDDSQLISHEVEASTWWLGLQADNLLSWSFGARMRAYWSAAGAAGNGGGARLQLLRQLSG